MGRQPSPRCAARPTLVALMVTCLVAGSWFASPVVAQGSGKRVDRRLDAAPLNRYLWGIVLLDADGRVLYHRNAERLFIPASNTKIVVAAVASALLPPDWTVATSVYATGPIVDGVVEGDLVLYGRGDPTMSRRCYAVDTTAAGVCREDPAEPLRDLAQQLRNRGVRSVTGDVIGDGSYFEPQLVHTGWEAYDLNWWYAAPVSGLGFNDNSIDITYRPGPEVGAPPVITFVPNYGDITLENRAQTTLARTRRTIDFYRRPGTLALWAEGSLPLDTPERTEYFALPDPNRFAAQAFRAALAGAGIGVGGETRSTTDSVTFHHARQAPPLAEVSSRPLRDWIFPILNTSQNWFAEMLLKQLGKQFGAGGSWDEGLMVERRFLIDSVGIDSTQFSLSDGSGLASTNLVTPLAFARLLRYIQAHPRAQTFLTGLPRSGSRGSLSTRFLGTPLEGRVVAKTGSISKVNTLTGYIERPHRAPLTFSVMANHHTHGYGAMLREIDSIVVELGRGR